MHRVSYIRIKNFRACRDVSLPLEGYTPLVGQNNTGKSSIIEALRWILKPSALQASDFADSNRPIEVCACVDGIDTEVLNRLPEKKHKSAIEPFCTNGFLWIRGVATGTGAKSIKEEVYNHESYSGNDVPTEWRDYPTGLPQAIRAIIPEPLYVEAMDDINEDLGKAKAGTTIKALLDEVMDPILKAHDELNNALITVKQILSADGKNRSALLETFDQHATSALENFFPGLELDLDLQVMDAKEFFKAGDLHVTDKLTGDRRKFDQMGTGAQRAIQMALIRYLAESRKSESERSTRRLLLIDEPELYLHPQGVRRLRQALLVLSRSGFQVVFSTHSPLMLSRDNAADAVIVHKTKEQGTTTRKPLRHAVVSALADGESQSRTLFELGNVAEIYFSDRIVLCEGKTDRRLLPLAYERLYGRSAELDQIAFVSLGSCSDIPKALPVLKAMGINSCAVADLDFAFTTARRGTTPLLIKEGEDIQKAKSILKRLHDTDGIPLTEDGLPTKDKITGRQAADTWALLARDVQGKEVALKAHSDLIPFGIWVWPNGCIEQVTDHQEKGENAIIDQENQLRDMSATDIDAKMPEFKQCFEWIRTM